MNVFSKIIICCITLIHIGCATSIKGKILQNTLLAGAAGAAYGNSLESHKTTHSAMYAGIASAVTAIATVYYLDPDKNVDSVRKTAGQLRDELDSFENRSSTRKYSQSSGSTIESFDKLPPEYRSMVDPGQWTLYELDEWIDGGEGRLIHQDKMLELKPATLKAR